MAKEHIELLFHVYTYIDGFDGRRTIPYICLELKEYCRARYCGEGGGLSLAAQQIVSRIEETVAPLAALMTSEHYDWASSGINCLFGGPCGDRKAANEFRLRLIKSLIEEFKHV